MADSEEVFVLHKQEYISETICHTAAYILRRLLLLILL